ncbi:NAD-dependent epimerase/dehydratase family protein [Thermophilibacter immobilis]|uniref:NAD-dependent epimerase/dehydratase family protein n=1 Tax=Thermophilibacter immobilis TaxID=2779519 RepID=A0A7S7M7X6_9ACTN|nr:NAD-dependent epimerase/dehydratase family protein [Thermophilibacter immobilis]
MAVFEPAGSYDYVVHCAANAHPSAYAKETVEMAWGIAYGAREILEALRRLRGSGRLLPISSSEVYGTRSGTELYGEGDYAYVDVTSPRSCYPSARRPAETLYAAYSTEYGVDVVMVRPSHVYGPQVTPADTRAHASFAREAAAGRDIVMKSEGNQLRSYTYSLDCATALLAVLLRGEMGQAYNISNPGPVVTVRQLAEALAVAGGVSVRFELPTQGERAAYNPMTCFALDSSKLEALGLKGAHRLARTAETPVGAAGLECGYCSCGAGASSIIQHNQIMDQEGREGKDSSRLKRTRGTPGSSQGERHPSRGKRDSKKPLPSSRRRAFQKSDLLVYRGGGKKVKYL